MKGETAPTEKLSERRTTGQAWRRSFGRRKGRKLSSRRAFLLSTRLNSMKLDLSVKPDACGLTGLFCSPVDEVWLEIGFEAGEHMIWQAERNRRIGIIGAEPYLNGVAAAISAIDERGLQDRTRIHAEDAIPLLHWLPPRSISRIFILFPDPWPKKRHRERRLISRATLDELGKALEAGGELRIASDVSDYAQEVLELASLHPAFEIVHIFRSRDCLQVDDWPVTRYEAKANKAGRSSTFLIIRRLDEAGYELQRA